jgi:hypothetical protein
MTGYTVATDIKAGQLAVVAPDGKLHPVSPEIKLVAAEDLKAGDAVRMIGTVYLDGDRLASKVEITD